MDDHEPDYGTYSARDLLDVARRVDRKTYPERARRIDEEVRRRAVARPPVDEQPGRAGLRGWRLLLVIAALLFAGLAVGLPLLVSIDMSSGFQARDRVARSVGSFSFVTPHRAVARLSADHGSSWEFDFIDARASAVLADYRVTVTFVNRGPHTIFATWQESARDGSRVEDREIALPPGRPMVFWAGKYGDYHDSRTQLLFVDRHASTYEVDVILEFDQPVNSGAPITPYVNTPVL